ncbi:hypothetical protein DRN86_04745 [Candidatus Geothermarchaeota archaeon]|nr:MAG: hypothetical protein DRN86_04745 [Candidatus Geothermarchaeota archaeon]
MRKVNIEGEEFNQCEVCVHYKLVRGMGFRCVAFPREVYLKYRDDICPLFKLLPRRIKYLRRLKLKEV